jgi:hypothetical protein
MIETLIIVRGKQIKAVYWDLSPEALQPSPSYTSGSNRGNRPCIRARRDLLYLVLASPSSRDHRSSPEINSQCASPADLIGTLASRWEPLSLSQWPSDLDLTILIVSLTEPIPLDLVRPLPLRSDGLSSWSERNGISKSDLATRQLQVKTKIK